MAQVEIKARWGAVGQVNLVLKLKREVPPLRCNYKIWAESAILDSNLLNVDWLGHTLRLTRRSVIG